MSEQESSPLWAVVEVFGHQTYVGQVQSHTIGGCSFVRIDVPALDGQQAYTKIFGNGAIYSITPVSEQVAVELVKRHRPSPVATYLLPAAHEHRARDYSKDRNEDWFDGDTEDEE